MAALQTIRSKGVLLVSIIALALFLFVAGDLFRGLESIFQNANQQIGEVDGQSVSIQEYQKLLDEVQVAHEIREGKSSFSEEELSNFKDEAWQSYCVSELIKKQCDELGLAVSDDEVSEVVKSGYSQYLRIAPFMNQQTQQYDYSILNTFLTEYKKMKDAGTQVPEEYEKLYKYYMYAQRQIRDQLLQQKYMTLLSQSFLSNPLEAQQAFDGRTSEAKLLLATLPAESVKDADITVSDEDIKAKYNEDKEQYKIMEEIRDVKIIDIQVVASEADKKAAEAELTEAANNLAAATTNAQAGNVTRQAASLLPYSDVYKKKEAFPSMISSTLDSTAVGTTTKPAYDGMTNTYYAYKLLDKATQPDSVLYRQLVVIGKDEADIAKKADSIMTALSGGAAFKELAKKYNQTGDSTWLTTQAYQSAALDADNTTFVNTIMGMNAGEVKKLTLDGGATVVLQAMKATSPVTKYNVAAVVKELRFSDETYSKEYNKFSSFVANNTTLDQIEANAPKNNYTIRPIQVSKSAHGIAGIRATRDALKWAFDEAKVGDISPLYECGSNDHMLLVALTGITPEGYAPVDNAQVKEQLTAKIRQEKKIAKLYDTAKNVKSMAEAQKLANVIVDTLAHVSFSNTAYVPQTRSSEPLVSAVASKTDKGAFAGPVKGNGGVYMFQVLDKSKTSEKFDAKAELASKGMSNFSKLGENQYYQYNPYFAVVDALRNKANIKDNRYKFF